MGQRLAFGGFELAAVLSELRSGDPAFVAQAGEFGAETASPYRLGLVGIPKAPETGARGGGHGGQDGLGIGGGDLGNFVEDDDCALREGTAVEGEAGDGHGRDAGLAEFPSGLVGGRQSDHRVSSGGGGQCRGVHRCRLPEPGRGDQVADGGAALAQGPYRVGLVGAEAGGLRGDGAFHHGRVEPGDRGGGEVVEMVKDPPFEEEVVPGGEQRGAPPGAVDQGDGVVGVEEGPGEALDGVDVEAAGAEGGDLRFVEPGPVSTQTFFGVDEALDGGFPLKAGAQLGDDPVGDLRFEGVAGRQSDLVRLRLPPFPEQLRRERPVLAGPGSE